MFATPTDTTLLAAYWAGMVSVALSLVLVAVVLALRWRLGYDARQWDRFVALWRPALMAMMLDPAAVETLPPLAPRDRHRFLRLWTYLHESVRGDAGAQLNAVARRLHVDAVARTLLRRGSPVERLQAVLALGHLRDADAWRMLMASVQDRDALLSVNAARALLQIDAERAIRDLLPMILQRSDWDLSRVAASLGQARAALPKLLMDHWPQMPMHALARGLRLTHAMRQSLPDDTLGRILDDPVPADVLCAALPLVNGAALLPRLRRLLEHPDAGVREQAAHRLGDLGEACDIDPLARLLQDDNWAVRLAAARALAKLPFLSPHRYFALTETESPARALLIHARAERELQ